VNIAKDDFSVPEAHAHAQGLQTIKNDDLEEIRELVSGTYGTVYYGKWKGSDVATKRIKASCFTGRRSEQERMRTDFWREAIILGKLHHPNVVAFYGIVIDGPDGILATVTEYVENGWLYSFYSCLIKKYDKAENIESKFAELERLPGDLNSQETSVSYSLKNNADLIACKAEYYHQCGEYQKFFELTTTLFGRDPFHLKCQPLPHRMQWIRGIVNCLWKARLQ